MALAEKSFAAVIRTRPSPHPKSQTVSPGCTSANRKIRRIVPGVRGCQGAPKKTGKITIPARTSNPKIRSIVESSDMYKNFTHSLKKSN
jgi:hypothetical protein